MSDMLTPMTVVLVFLLPATLAGLALVLGAGRRGAGSGGRLRARWMGALGVAIGFLAGYVGLLKQVPPLPPHDASAALFHVVAAAGLLAWFDAGGPVAVRLAVRALVSVGAPALYLKNLVRNWEGAELLQQLGPIALVTFVLWTGMDALARRRPGAAVPLSLWLGATGLSAGLLWTGAAVNAQLAGTLAAVLGAATVAGWMRSSASLAGGAAGVAAVALTTLAAGGVHLSELPAWSALAFALAPLLAWLVPESEQHPARAVVLRLALVAVPVAAGLWLAWENRPPPDPYADSF